MNFEQSISNLEKKIYIYLMRNPLNCSVKKYCPLKLMKNLYIKALIVGVLVCTVLFNTFAFLVLSAYSVDRSRIHKYESEKEEVLQFPEGFKWGAASASYQFEGGNFDSNWWRFEQNGGIKDGQTAAVADDFYNRYEGDFDLLEELNMNSFRMSIEWSRVEPELGKFDEQAIEHYRQMLVSLRERGIEPMVTLWHFSTPIWFEDLGSWEKASNIQYYEDYVRFVVEQLSDEVTLWITINEPMAYISSGYMVGKWPPGEQSPQKLPVLLSNIITGHNKAYDIIHDLDDDAQVGIAEHASYVAPAHQDNLIENIVSFGIDYSWTYFLLDRVRSHLDYVGVHYYYKQTISVGLINDLINSDSISNFESESTDRAYYPHGLYEVLLRFKKYNMPVYITEIGVPDYHEIPRDQFIREHVREMYYAIKAGVDLRGVYYWSLLDNFEWSEGYGPKFGLVEVDFDTQERSIKQTSWEYAMIAGCNCVGND